MKAEAAIQTAPGVLAVKADYESGQVTIGTASHDDVSVDEIVTALQSIGYGGKPLDQSAKVKSES